MSQPRGGAPHLPKNYRLVYQVICGQGPGAHATTRGILAAAERLQPGIGQSTVYRALDRLCALGLVAEVRLPGNASAVYEQARASHAHFLCTSCGEVDDVDWTPPAAELDALVKSRGIEVSDALLTLRGTCARCRR